MIPALVTKFRSYCGFQLHIWIVFASHGDISAVWVGGVLTSHAVSVFCICRFDHSSVSGLLDEKSHLVGVRQKYGAYRYEREGDDEGGGGGEGESCLFEFDQYNDEYDDTYDSHNVGAPDNDSPDELFSVKRLVSAQCRCFLSSRTSTLGAVVGVCFLYLFFHTFTHTHCL